MGKLSCFSGIVGKKKKDKGNKDDLVNLEFDEPIRKQHFITEHPVKSVNNVEISSTSFSVPVPSGSSECKVQVVNHEIQTKIEVEEVAYEGEDEQDEKKDYSDGEALDIYNSHNTEKYEEEEGVTSSENIESGNLSDPGIGKAEFWSSPGLKRSCSNLELRDIGKKESSTKLPAVVNSQTPDSPASVFTQVSADKVMLKKHSSSQILPSRSRRLWWKLFLWSHRNLHHEKQNLPQRTPYNQQGGYSSDTLEPNRFMELGKMDSPGSFTGSGLQCGSGMWPQNQWVALPSESSSHHLTRVDEWVKELSTQQPSLIDNDEEQNDDVEIAYPPSPHKGKSHMKSTSYITEEIVHANNVIQSLNSSTTVAHISGMGLKVIPHMSHLSSLRYVNLSGNYIVQITQGSLPKGLHTLNLSRNKISTIDGLRELTHLRVLDLSYNRISRIGQGLSNCTNIKELYLGGNKISYVEGLHRLLKLLVLELSFNKITTAKSLGQLVANYNSLLSLNLLGNPIQSNVSEDQLKKAVLGLLPKLAFLNKQAINTQKARLVAAEAISRAAAGSNGWTARSRKSVKRSGHSASSSSVRGGGTNLSVSHKSKHRLRSKSAQQSGLKSKSSTRV